ncbi:hypothetical protein ISS30_05935 [bacterium]|nr:hypothetical protein [FCB group bacterium]MBL7191217.1 hypothetical protein [bacterium]
METFEYIVNEKGERRAVIVPYNIFKELMELAEDTIDISLIKEVKNEQYLDWEEVKREFRKAGKID